MPKVIDHDARRREVADAAWRIIGQQGVHGLTLRAVGSAMGRSTTAVTHYFPDRESLIITVVRETIAGWQRDFLALTEERDPETAIGLGALWALQYGAVERAHNRAYLSMVDVAATLEPVRESLDRWDEWLIDRTIADMRAWMDELEQPPAIDARTATHLLHHVGLGVTLSGSYSHQTRLYAYQVELLKSFFTSIGLPVPRPVAEHESWSNIYASGEIAPIGEMQLKPELLVDR